MAIRFQILGSSSSGNCALIETEQTRILLDAGFSGRRIEQMLEEIGKPIDTVEAVFLTHEHGDHICGLRGLARHRHLEFFANYGTAQLARGKASSELRWRLFESGMSFAFKDLQVETVRLPHDAMDPVGFIFRTEGTDLFNPACSLAWMTDLGHAPSKLAERVRDVQVLLLEANHDPDLLDRDTKRPESVKRRISGRHGHLSNAAAQAFLASVAAPRWSRVLLGHLSRDCNDRDRVLECMGGSACPWPVECLDPEQLIFPAVDLAGLSPCGRI